MTLKLDSIDNDLDIVDDRNTVHLKVDTCFSYVFYEEEHPAVVMKLSKGNSDIQIAMDSKKVAQLIEYLHETLTPLKEAELNDLLTRNKS